MHELIKKAIPGIGDDACDKFVTYYTMLLDWNSRMNLTAITEPWEVAQKHFADSLAALPYLPQNARVVDVGTGAGFPGVPLLIMRPDLKLTLVDSLQKRVNFLDTVLQTLGLQAETVHARAEDFGRMPAYRETFEIAVSRAVANLSTLLELTIPLVRVGGKSICYKGDAAAELASAKSALHLLHTSAETVEIPAVYGARSLLICTKNAPTPKTYPRKAGVPSKQPL